MLCTELPPVVTSALRLLGLQGRLASPSTGCLNSGACFAVFRPEMPNGSRV